MKKIQKSDLKLEKEVISSLSAGDLSDVKGGATTLYTDGLRPCCFILYTKDAACLPTADGCTKTCLLTVCNVRPEETVDVCMEPISVTPQSCPCQPLSVKTDCFILH